MTSLNIGNLNDFKTELTSRSERPYIAYLSFSNIMVGEPAIFIRRAINVQAPVSGAILKFSEIVGEAMVYDEEAVKKLDALVEKSKKKIEVEFGDEISIRLGWFE